MGMVEGPIAGAIATLPCWSGAIQVAPLSGGLTNHNYLVTDSAQQRFVVRQGEDMPVHGIMRFNELASAKAAFAAGIGPQVIYACPGFMVSRFVAGAVLTPALVRNEQMLRRIAALMRRCHWDMPHYFQGPALYFWVFQVIRSYFRYLQAATESSHMASLLDLSGAARRLEAAVGAVTIGFGHNDLLAANLIDDGSRLWLIDWDYGGFNSPLFDLANLASNNQLPHDSEQLLLEAYFEQPPTRDVRRGFDAMLCASLLRELLWAIVSGLSSTIEFDYRGYAADYQQRFERQWQQFETQYG
jgi:thiamine kinase-like enzyme